MPETETPSVHKLEGSSSHAIAVRDCALALGRAGAERVEFLLTAFEAGHGDRVALTGPSGCGKSTLLNLVSGLLTPDRGAVEIEGVEISRLSQRRRDSLRGRTMGLIFQTFNLLDGFTALENVLLAMRFGRSVPHGERRSRAAALLKRVGLARRIHARPSRLSVGERQRVAIARAIANRPSLLLADEPTSSLPPATAGEVFDLILEICDETKCSLLFVTHDPALAARLPRQFDCRGLIRNRAAGEAAA